MPPSMQSKPDRPFKTDIIILLINTGLMWFGFFMLIPLLAVHITRDLVLGAALAGGVLAIRQFVQQGLGLFAGPLSDWLGYREMVLAGVLVRAIGFAWMAVATEPVGLMLSGIVAGLGGAGFDASGKAALAALSVGYKRDNVLSLSMTFGNTGMALGPLVGALLIKVNFMVVGLAAAGMYVLSFFLVLFLVPKIESSFATDRRPTPGEIFGKLGQVWNNRSFVTLCTLLVGYYLLYVQINITIPLIAVKLTGTEDSVVPLFTINSCLAIFLQYLSIKFLRKWLSPVAIITLGVALMAIGMAGIILIDSYAMLVVMVVIFALGRLVVDPITISLTAQYSTSETLASYFGFSSLALALGGMVGNSLGGFLFDTGYAIGFPGLCWAVFAVVGALVVVGLLVFQVREGKRLSKVAPVVTAVAEE